MGEFQARKFDFTGNGIAIWEDQDSNGNKILKVKVLSMQTIVCFKPKEQIVTADKV